MDSGYGVDGISEDHLALLFRIDELDETQLGSWCVPQNEGHDDGIVLCQAPPELSNEHNTDTIIRDRKQESPTAISTTTHESDETTSDSVPTVVSGNSVILQVPVFSKVTIERQPTPSSDPTSQNPTQKRNAPEIEGNKRKKRCTRKKLSAKDVQSAILKQADFVSIQEQVDLLEDDPSTQIGFITDPGSLPSVNSRDFPSTRVCKGTVFPPLHPLSAYNYFFRDERERILNSDQPTNLSRSDHRAKLLWDHWKRDRTQRRIHRKSHGKISFQELNKRISAKWKALPTSEVEFYKEVSAIDAERFRRESSLVARSA